MNRASAKSGGGGGLTRIIGTSSNDVFAVETGLAFDAPSVFVYRQSGSDFERTMLDGTDRLEIFGLGGNDRLTIGPGVFGDREVPVLGGMTRLDGVDLIVFRGGAGDDTLAGFNADGRLVAHGGSGDDRLVGGSKADLLRGGAGDDILVGHRGADDLKGDDGRDTFVYKRIADAPLDGPARERITDFERGEDVIDLSEIKSDGLRFLGNYSPEIQLLRSGDVYYDPEEQTLNGFVGNYISYSPNFTIALPGVEALDQGDLIL